MVAQLPHIAGADVLVTHPTIDLGSVIPADQGNTVALSQPLLARITDSGGPGLLSSSINFTLSDLTNGKAASFNGPTVMYNRVTGVAKTSPAILEAAHEYEAQLSASDLSGQVVTESWRFRAIALSVASAVADMDGTAGVATGNGAWQFVPHLYVGRFCSMATSTTATHARASVAIAGGSGARTIPATGSGCSATTEWSASGATWCRRTGTPPTQPRRGRPW